MELEAQATEKLKRIKTAKAEKAAEAGNQNLAAMISWCDEMDRRTDELYKQMYGDRWQEIRALETQNLIEKQTEATKKRLAHEHFLKKNKAEKDVKIFGFSF